MRAMGTFAGDILKDAVFYISADDHQASGSNPKTIRNLGVAGSDLDCRSGSTSAPDSNDPKFLDYQGTPYVYLPGGANNYLSVPYIASFQVTNLDVDACIALDSWTPASAPTISTSSNGSPNRRWSFSVGTDGKLNIIYSTDGTALTTRTSTVATGLGAGEKKWIRATLLADNGSTQNVAKFYLSDDGVTWTQLGSTVTSAGVATVYKSTSAPFSVDVASGTMAGKVFRARWRDAIDGNLLVDVDCSYLTSGSATSFVEKSSNAATVTINRSTSGRKSVAVVAPLWLLGTDDWLETRDHPALNFYGNDSFTMMAVVRIWATAVSFGRIVTKGRAGSEIGYILESSNTSLLPRFDTRDSNGNNPISNSLSAQSSGALMTWAGIRDVNSKSIYTQNNTTRSARVADTSTHVNTPVALTIGAGRDLTAQTGSFQDMELMSVAIFRRALSSSEIATLNTYMTGKWL